jgi:uncharacterized protein YqjF (DUF2071 family)
MKLRWRGVGGLKIDMHETEPITIRGTRKLASGILFVYSNEKSLCVQAARRTWQIWYHFRSMRHKSSGRYLQIQQCELMQKEAYTIFHTKERPPRIDLP